MLLSSLMGFVRCQKRFDTGELGWVQVGRQLLSGWTLEWNLVQLLWKFYFIYFFLGGGGGSGRGGGGLGESGWMWTEKWSFCENSFFFFFFFGGGGWVGGQVSWERRSEAFVKIQKKKKGGGFGGQGGCEQKSEAFVKNQKNIYIYISGEVTF